MLGGGGQAISFSHVRKRFNCFSQKGFCPKVAPLGLGSFGLELGAEVQPFNLEVSKTRHVPRLKLQELKK